MQLHRSERFRRVATHAFIQADVYIFIGESCHNYLFVATKCFCQWQAAFSITQPYSAHVLGQVAVSSPKTKVDGFLQPLKAVD